MDKQMYERKHQNKSTLKKFDIFSLPFKFNFGDEGNEKKTIAGGLFSLIIILLSFAYFIYLCVLYFDNRIQPSISYTNELSEDPFSMEINESFIAIKILIKGQSLIDFQQEKQKLYLDIFVIYSDKDGKQKAIRLNQCLDENLKQYMCFDFKSIQNDDKFYLNFDPNAKESQNDYVLFFNICDQNKYGQDCEDEQIIRDTLLQLTTQAYVKFGLKQYNPRTKKIEERVQEEEFIFDEKLAFLNSFVFQKTDLTTSTGFIIQSNDYFRFISDVKQTEKILSQSYLNKLFDLNLLGCFSFTIGQDNINKFIQFPQFTSILAQFTSLFNTFMLFGIIIKFLAQTEILQSFAELQLKLYYKKTAEQLIDDTCDKIDVKKVKSEGVISLWRYIQNMNFNSIQNKLNISFFKKQNIFIEQYINKQLKYIKSYIYKILQIDLQFLNQLLVQKILHQFSNNLKKRSFLVKRSNKSLSIFEIQKELIQLKIMLRLLISPEQFAAMQLCGSRLSFSTNKQKVENKEVELCEKQFNNSKQINESCQNEINNEQDQSIFKEYSPSKKQITVFPLVVDEKKGENSFTNQQNENIQNKINIMERYVNHLEKIDQIERDEVLLSQCVNNFLQNNNCSSSELNSRILGCMIGIDQDQMSFKDKI